jgi:hypothetical protein
MALAIRDEVIEELLQGYRSPEDLLELLSNLGDSRRVQAAAVSDREDAGLAATSIPSVNLTP